MKRFLGLLVVVMVLMSMQSCFVKTRPNMAFVDRTQLSADAEVVSMKIPGFLMKTFIRGEIKELKESDPMLAMALKKIKTIKFMAIDGGADSKVYENFSKYLAKNKFEEMMSIYSDGAKISINTQMKGNNIKKVMLGIIDEGDHVFVDMKTDLNLDELSQLVSYYEENNKKEKKEKLETSN